MCLMCIYGFFLGVRTVCNVCCTVIIGAKSLFDHVDICRDLQVTQTTYRYRHGKYLKSCPVHRKRKILFGGICPGCIPEVEVRILDSGRNWRRNLREYKDNISSRFVYKVAASEQYWGPQSMHVPNSDTGLVNENCMERYVEHIRTPNKGLLRQSRACDRCHIKSCGGAECKIRLICGKCFCPIDHYFYHYRVCASQFRNRLNFKSRTGKV